MPSVNNEVPQYELTFAKLTGSDVQSGERAYIVTGDRSGRELRLQLDQGAIENIVSQALTPVVSDLIDLSIMVNVADRTQPRSMLPYRDLYETAWTRRLHLTVPVRQPDVWSNSLVAERLRSLLWFLTGDLWEFDFQPNRTQRMAQQCSLFSTVPVQPFEVALFSGGLDSTAGLCSELLEHPPLTVVAVSAKSNSRIGQVQDQILNHLRTTCQVGDRVIQVGIPYHLIETRQEASYQVQPMQRSRGFAYLALGAATALMAGTDRLYVFENGIGAFNLPYTGAQVGSHSMRAVHPETLLRMSQLVVALTGQPFHIYNRFQWKTKAEVCEPLAREHFRDLIAMTMSCERFPRRVPGKPECGICTSCVLRRQALLAAGLERFDHTEQYQYDSAACDVSDWPDNRRFPLWAMLDQVDNLRQCLASPRYAWGALVKRWPDLDVIAEKESGDRLSVADVRERIVHLYGTHVAEWDAVRHRLLPTGTSADLPGHNRSEIATRRYHRS